jgi:nitrogen fixation protein FixH
LLYPETSQSRSARRRPNNWWPYGIVTAFVLFIGVQIALIRIAASGFEGPDRVDYYRLGLEYNQELRRQQLQKESGWHLDSQLQPGTFRARMLDREGKPVVGTMKVTFRRPVTKKEDQLVVATLVGGTYVAHWNATPGQWVLDVRFQSARYEWVGQQRTVVNP